MKNTQTSIASSSLQILIELKNDTLHFGENFPVKISISNNSDSPQMVNQRLSMGYRESMSRELFVEISLKGSSEIISVETEDYERDPALVEDYTELSKGELISREIDLLQWYSIEGLPEGNHTLELVIYYQADEDVAENKPENVLGGVYASERLEFTFVR